MRGRDVLWQPGTDHAGIATQMVVERQLMEKQEPPAHARARGVRAPRLGVEGDERLDHRQSAEAPRRFVRLVARALHHGRARRGGRPNGPCRHQGLRRSLQRAAPIYKDKRLVNWDPKFQTAISDLEVVQVESKGSFTWAAGDPEKPFDAEALAKVLKKDPSRAHVSLPLSAREEGARATTAITSSSPRRAPRPCSATRASPCIPRTSATRR